MCPTLKHSLLLGRQTHLFRFAKMFLNNFSGLLYPAGFIHLSAIGRLICWANEHLMGEGRIKVFGFFCYGEEVLYLRV